MATTHIDVEPVQEYTFRIFRTLTEFTIPTLTLESRPETSTPTPMLTPTAISEPGPTIEAIPVNSGSKAWSPPDIALVITVVAFTVLFVALAVWHWRYYGRHVQGLIINNRENENSSVQARHTTASMGTNTRTSTRTTTVDPPPIPEPEPRVWVGSSTNETTGYSQSSYVERVPAPSSYRPGRHSRRRESIAPIDVNAGAWDPIELSDLPPRDHAVPAPAPPPPTRTHRRSAVSPISPSEPAIILRNISGSARASSPTVTDRGSPVSSIASSEATVVPQHPAPARTRTETQAQGSSRISRAASWAEPRRNRFRRSSHRSQQPEPESETDERQRGNTPGSPFSDIHTVGGR